jgi:hypothetical protein
MVFVRVSGSHLTTSLNKMPITTGNGNRAYQTEKDVYSTLIGEPILRESFEKGVQSVLMDSLYSQMELLIADVLRNPWRMG